MQFQNDSKRVLVLFASRLKFEIKCHQINVLKIKHTQCIHVSVSAIAIPYLVALLESCFHSHFHHDGISQIRCNKDVFRKFCDYFSAYKIVFSFVEMFEYIDLAKKAKNRQIKLCR